MAKAKKTTTKKKAKKRPVKKKPAARRKKSVAARAASAAEDVPDIDVGKMPPASDPKAQAKYLIDLLDAYAQQGTPEAIRVRTVLVQAVQTYDTAEDKDQAQLEFVATLYGIEAGVIALLVQSTSKVHEHMAEQARRIGINHPAGQQVRIAADAMGQVTNAMETMLRAVDQNSTELRSQAGIMLAQASQIISTLK